MPLKNLTKKRKEKRMKSNAIKKPDIYLLICFYFPLMETREDNK